MERWERCLKIVIYVVCLYVLLLTSLYALYFYVHTKVMYIVTFHNCVRAKISTPCTSTGGLCTDQYIACIYVCTCML